MGPRGLRFALERGAARWLVKAERAAQSDRHRINDAHPTVIQSLPTGFVFDRLLAANGRVEIFSHLRSGLERRFIVDIRKGELWATCGQDSVQGLSGKGLKCENLNSLATVSSLKAHWTPEPVACYRNKRLLGIWEPALEGLREASGDEAAKVFEVEQVPISPTLPRFTPPSSPLRQNKGVGQRPSRSSSVPTDSIASREKKAQSLLRMARSLAERQPDKAREYATRAAETAPATNTAREAERFLQSLEGK